jgi:competence protein ComEC
LPADRRPTKDKRMSIPRSTQAHAPLLLWLLGMLIGLNLASHKPAQLALLLGGALLGGGIALCLVLATRLKRTWIACFLISTTLSFWAYGQIRLPANPDPFNLTLPAREARLTLEIQRVMQPEDRYGQASGIARVVSAPPTSRLCQNDRIYFRFTRVRQLPAAIQPGLQLEATGILSPIPPAAPNSPSTDFDAYLKGIGVHYRFARTGQVNILRAPARFQRFCSATNERFQHILRLGEPADTELANVYVAMLLGRKIELSSEQSERYRTSGTMHFFAISGLHIGVIATVIAHGLLLLRVPRGVSPCIGLSLLFLYVEITGASPSAVRAFLMATFFWASFAVQRQRSAYAALIGSATLVLIFDPRQLWSLGFQLSYTVVVSILLFGLPLHQVLNQRCRPFRWLPEDSWTRRQRLLAWSLDKGLLLFAISFAAWLASSPLSAGHFQFIVPNAILLNMLLVNLASLAIIGGVIALSCGNLGLLLLAEFINHSAWTVLSMMDQLIILSAQLPGETIHCPDFPPALSYASLAAYFACLLWLHDRPERLSSAALLLPPLTILCPLTIGLLAD